MSKESDGFENRAQWDTRGDRNSSGINSVSNHRMFSVSESFYPF